MNSITEFLDLEDPDVYVSDSFTEGSVKTIILESRPANHYCPECGFRMHSKGIHTRKINHPILQNSYTVRILLKQRRWKCTNPNCGYTMNESFNFVNKRRRSTNATDMLVLDAFRSLTETAADIAKRFNISDSQAIKIFDKYVKMPRLPLTDAVSVDEVHIDMDRRCKYALVIQDFHSGDPLDVLISRRTEITEPYFAGIPLEERLGVRYLISDMYNPYISYVEKYFPNAVSVVDSFHVQQWIIRKIDNYLRSLLKEYRKRDDERQERISSEHGRSIQLPMSHEVYLLKHYKWLILANQSNITYHDDFRMDHHFHCLMNTYTYETRLLAINSRLYRLRDLKEKYVRFNTRNAGNPEQASKELDDLIDDYLHCGDSIFVEFALLLGKYKQQIINSFIMVSRMTTGGERISRLSNGPMESMNRKVKDLKRIGRGYRNFDHFRNRFLYATRNSPVIDASSGPEHTYEYITDEED